MVVGDDGLYRNLHFLCTVHLVVRIPPFHGGYTSSNLVRCTILKHIAMPFRGGDHKESSVFQYGNVARSGFGEEICYALK